MIDFTRFWAEAGCAPGLNREETEALLRQLAERYGQPSGSPVSFDSYTELAPGMSPGAGITADRAAEWEGTHGVVLPVVLRQALAVQDGGYMRDTHFRILPLDEIDIPDDEFWEYASYEEGEIADRKLIFHFAWDEEVSGSYYLNYNAQGPEKEPSVYVHHHDPGDLDRCAKSVTRFFERMLDASEQPAVQWSEAQTLAIIAQESLDLSALYGGNYSLEQILARQGENLVFFTHVRDPNGEHFVRTTLPLPLEDGAAMGLVSIRPHRPGPGGTYSLYLQPRAVAVEGIVEVRSQKTSDGRWKNSTTRGAPICVMFESRDRSRLESLQEQLLGAEAAQRARASDQRQQDFQRKMKSLSSEGQHAARMQMLLKAMEQLGGPAPANAPPPSGIPPELADAAALIQERMLEVLKRAQETASKQPLNPEMLKLLEEMMRHRPS
jgi:hypothetical protein